MPEVVSPSTVAAQSRAAGDTREGSTDAYWLARIADIGECFRREMIETRAAFSGQAESETVTPSAVKSASLAALEARTGTPHAELYARIGDVVECMRRELVALRAVLTGAPATEVVSVASIRAASIAGAELQLRTGSNEAAMLARLVDTLEAARREYVAVKDALPAFLA